MAFCGDRSGVALIFLVFDSGRYSATARAEASKLVVSTGLARSGGKARWGKMGGFAYDDAPWAKIGI